MDFPKLKIPVTSLIPENNVEILDQRDARIRNNMTILMKAKWKIYKGDVLALRWLPLLRLIAVLEWLIYYCAV